MERQISSTRAYEESEDVGRNSSENLTFGEVIGARFNRRDLLKGTLAATAIATTVSPLALAVAEAQAQGANPTFTFKEVAAGVDDKHYIAEGYDADILIRWGDPIFADGPDFDPLTQTPEKQRRQFGYNNDFLGYFPLEGSTRGLLVANHEYTSEELMFPGLGM
jgi:secreted PhoX family phosphatase